MLPILTYLMCVYLVFKGVEILQISLASPKSDKQFSVVIGVLALIASVGIAIFFAVWVTSLAAGIDGLPR